MPPIEVCYRLESARMFCTLTLYTRSGRGRAQVEALSLFAAGKPNMYESMRCRSLF